MSGISGCFPFYFYIRNRRTFFFLYQESEDVFIFISGIGGRFSFYIWNRRKFFFLYQESEDIFLFISGIGGRFSFIPGGCCFLHHILEAVSSFTPWCWSLFSLLQNWRLFYISDSDTGHHRTRKRDSGHSTDWTVGIGQRH